MAHSLLKLAPYDPNTMACEGLQKYVIFIVQYRYLTGTFADAFDTIQIFSGDSAVD